MENCGKHCKSSPSVIHYFSVIIPVCVTDLMRVNDTHEDIMRAGIFMLTEK